MSHVGRMCSNFHRCYFLLMSIPIGLLLYMHCQSEVFTNRSFRVPDLTGLIIAQYPAWSRYLKLSKNSNSTDVKSTISLGSSTSRQYKYNHSTTFDYSVDSINESISTQACVIPRLSLATDANRFAFRDMEPLSCGEGFNFFYPYKGFLRLNQRALEGRNLTHCNYTGIIWRRKVEVAYTTTIKGKFPFNFKIKHDHFMVKCISESEETFTQFFAEIVEKSHVLHRKKRGLSSGPNVLIIAFDSMSHLSFERKLPKLVRYMKETLNSTILNGYNIVGDATIAALVPILTGKHDDELPEVRRAFKGYYVDEVFPIIWYDFKRHGYATKYSEDTPYSDTFVLRYQGFKRQPTDHYIMPFWRAAQSSETKSYCLGGIPRHIYTLNYTRDFMKSYGRMPKFAFTFFGDLCHDDNNPVEYADEDTVNLLEDLKQAGILDNTVLIIMADHGARYGIVRRTPQGKLEERLPMMSFTFPPKFHEEYPDNMHHLIANIDRLSTPFDLHETLQDILKPARLKENPDFSSRGLSLLREIPLNRTCESAGVPFQWCTCLNWEELSVEDGFVRNLAKVMVNKINSWLENNTDICSELVLMEIKAAKKVIPHEKNAEQYYGVMIETLPNHGIFEAYAIHQPDDTIEVSPDMSRLDAYGSQSDCVTYTFPHLREYCYCKDKQDEAP